MLADAEAGPVDVVVVHKLDRFARNLRVTLETLERLERAGVGFVSIAEQMDFTTPIGKVILARSPPSPSTTPTTSPPRSRRARPSARRRASTTASCPSASRRTPTGIPVARPGDLPRPAARLPDLAPAGKSDREVAARPQRRRLPDHGQPRAQPLHQGHRLPHAAEPVLPGRAAGRRGGWLPGAHEPMLDDALFARGAAGAGGEPQRPPPPSVAPTRRTHSLSGLARCGRCGGRLHFQTDRDGRARVYCARRLQGKTCGQRSALLDVLEAQLAAYLATSRCRRRRWRSGPPARGGQRPARRRRAAAAGTDGRLERIRSSTSGAT